MHTEDAHSEAMAHSMPASGRPDADVALALGVQGTAVNPTIVVVLRLHGQYLASALHVPTLEEFTRREGIGNIFAFLHLPTDAVNWGLPRCAQTLVAAHDALGTGPGLALEIVAALRLSWKRLFHVAAITLRGVIELTEALGAGTF